MAVTLAAPRSSTVTRLGTVCLVAGLLGAASGIFLAVVEPSVPDTQFSYPLTAGGFAAIQTWFFVQHLGLLAGQHAFWASGALGRSRAARIGHVVAFAGMCLLAVTELIAITAADSAYPSDRTDVLDILYGIASVACGVGFIVAGIAAQGWARKLALALGIWVFVPMTPAMMAGFLPARLSITGWMLLYAALGWALSRPSASTPR